MKAPSAANNGRNQYGLSSCNNGQLALAMTLHDSKPVIENAPFSILHIISSVNPLHGGPIEGVLQQAAQRILGNFKVDIVSLDLPSDSFVRSCPVKVHALGEGRVKPVGWKRYLPWVHYGYAPKFISWLRDHIGDYDVVVVNGLWNYATFGASQTLVNSGVPYVVFTHGMLDPWFRKTYPLKDIVKQVFWWFCEGRLLNNAKAVLFTSEEEKILARNAFWPYRPREKVVGYGTGDVSGDIDAETSAFRELIPELNEKPYILFLSRIHPKKGCDLLISAFAEIARAYPDLNLVIAGPDQIGWRKNLEQQAKMLGVEDRIYWPGMLTGDTKWGAFRQAAAFLLPSHQENFGVVVAEAMAVGTPVLITDKVNIWREVKSCGGGFVETDDRSGISRLLKQFCALSAEGRRKMSQNARAGFLQYFEISNAVETINAVLRDVKSMRGK